jgi:hypothetical protein
MIMEEKKMPSKLTKGSRYRVTSRWGDGGVKVSEGEFEGHVMIGTDTGLCLQIMEEAVRVHRIIPTAAVLAIDILTIKEEDEEKKKETPQVSYG